MEYCEGDSGGEYGDSKPPIEQSSDASEPPNVPTAVGAPIWGDHVFVVNRTRRPWILHCGYHYLGAVASGGYLPIHVPRGGTFSARSFRSSPDEPYLLIDLPPSVWAVEIRQSSGVEGGFELTAVVRPQPAERRSGGTQRMLDESIEELGLSARAENALKRVGLTTVGEVIRLNPRELLSIRNFGWKSYDNLMERLAQHGFGPP